MIAFLGVGWAVVFAIPLFARARSALIRSRGHELRPADPSITAHETHRGVAGGLPLSRFGRWVPGAGRRARRRRLQRLRRHLPNAAELLRAGVGAGMTPVGALEIVVPRLPPDVAGPLADSLRAQRLGESFAVAIDSVESEEPELSPLVAALRTSTHEGVPADRLLAQVAEDARAQWRRCAEAQARTVPVRLLFPLVLCVLPAFVLLGIAPPILSGFAS